MDILNNSAQQIAEQVLNEKLSDLGTSIPQYKHLAISLMVKFARIMCEKQKEECLQSAMLDFHYDGTVSDEYYSGYINVQPFVEPESILECKNVCD